MDMHFQFTLAADLIAALDTRTCVYAESCAANAQPTVRRGSFFPLTRPRDHGPHRRQHNTANPI